VAKKPAKKEREPKSKGGMDADDHRKIANTLQARARIHHAKADLAEALNPPKKGSTRGSPY
jgi:hypothetical protein